MGSLLPRARHPCWFSKQACRRATTLIALASCSSILCIATRGPLARTRAAPVIVGRCGCTVGGTSAAAMDCSATPAVHAQPRPMPGAAPGDYRGDAGLPHLGTRGIGTQLGQAVRMDRPIHHQMAASGLEADKIISRRGGRRSRPPRLRASSAGRRHPARPGLPPNSHRTERSGHFGTDGQSSRISKYSAGHPGGRRAYGAKSPSPITCTPSARRAFSHRRRRSRRRTDHRRHGPAKACRR